MAKIADQDPVRPTSLAFRNATTGDAILVDSSNPMPINRPDAAAVTFTPGSANNAILFSTATTGFGGCVVQFTGTWTETVTFQSSNDNTNWNTVEAVALGGGTGLTSVTGNGMFWISCHALYVRAQITAYTSGTVNGTVALRSHTIDPIAGNVVLGGGSSTIGTANIGIAGTAVNNNFTTVKVISAAAAFTGNAGAGTKRVMGGALYNSGTAAYFKLFNKNGSPTLGTDTPVITLTIPPSASLYLADVCSVFGITPGTTGLSYAITGGSADNDSTALSAGQIVGSFFYV